MAVNHRFGGVITGTAGDSFAAEPSPTIENIAGGATFTANVILGNRIGTITNPGAVIGNTPTAAQIVAGATNPQVGDYFTCRIGPTVGTAANTLTLAAGAGVTLAAGIAPTAPGGVFMTWSVELTNVSSGTEAVTMTRIG